MEKFSLLSVCEIRPYLLISGYCTLSEQKLRQLDITGAVDATNIPKSLRISGIEYLTVPVDDSELGHIRDYFEPVAKLVEKTKNAGSKTLIYCAAGISRSATLCITTLMILEGLSLEDAYANVLSARPVIAPNLGFWRQMIEFEREKFGTSTVELLKGMRRPVPSVYVKRSSLLKNASK